MSSLGKSMKSIQGWHLSKVSNLASPSIIVEDFFRHISLIQTDFKRRAKEKRNLIEWEHNFQSDTFRSDFVISINYPDLSTALNTLSLFRFTSWRWSHLQITRLNQTLASWNEMLLSCSPNQAHIRFFFPQFIMSEAERRGDETTPKSTQRYFNFTWWHFE